MRGILPFWEIKIPKNSKSEQTERKDLIKEDNDMTASTDTISQLTQDLDFLRKDFNEYIQIINTKSYEENTEFLDKISNIQKMPDLSIKSLSTFIKGALTAQNTVITSLKEEQEYMDV